VKKLFLKLPVVADKTKFRMGHEECCCQRKKLSSRIFGTALPDGVTQLREVQKRERTALTAPSPH
jgi:hypothetical protein